MERYLASERVFDGTPINLGTGQKHRLIDVAETIFSISGLETNQDKI